MPRPPRIVIPNCPHHITQRGNKKEDVFFSPGDQDLYLQLLRKYCSEYGVSILGYCLMTNHVHIVATPSSADGLSRAIGLTHNDYSRWLHVRRNECGHLWQTRFYSCPVEERYLWTVLAYVERNEAHLRALEELRALIHERTLSASCLGFGPRFQHSTGQAYKGGPNSGVFLQITADDPADVPVPGERYTFGVVKAAQARGDFDVLAERGRRALRVHVVGDLESGFAKLIEAAQQALK